MNNINHKKIIAKIALMKGLTVTLFTLVFALLIISCGDEAKKSGPTDTMTSGTLEISADETYKPVLEEHVKVFDSSYPEAHIKIQYKSESECLVDFLNGKVKMILITRELTDAEIKLAEEKKIITTALPIAKDAIAIITNKENTDNRFSKSKIRGILTGQYDSTYSIVFDHSGSSTLRYMLDSLIPSEKLASNVYAANSNDSVIKYVVANKKSIGFVSVSYVSDYNDPEGLAFISDVNVGEVYNDSLEKFYQPYQAFIAPEWYPLTRKLYYIHKENYPGIATGFAKFLREERGQLIFKQARLFPTRVNIIFRQAELNN